jgi:two-component system NtrC family sensor kinase
VPALGFAGSALISWRQVAAETEVRLTRRVDMLHEHALRLLETQEAVIAAANGYIAGLSWDEIAGSAEVHSFLQRLQRSTPSTRGVALVAPDGRLATVSSASFPTPRPDLSDREYAAAHRAGHDGAYISGIIVTRPTGALVASVSRARTTGPEGRPDGGIVVSSISPEAIASFYHSVVDTPRDAVTLARSDGAVIARYPAPPETAGWRALPGNPVVAAQAASADGRGILRVTSGFDGVSRITALRRVEGYPVFVAYGLDREVVRGAWIGRLLAPAAGALAAMALLIWLTRRAQAAAWRGRAEAERRADAEAALRHAERVNALGRLAAGVAHDFSNAVQAITSGVRLIVRHAEDPAQIRRYAGLVEEAAGRAGALTRRMLDFSRRGGAADASGDLDVAAALTSANELLGPTLGAGYRVRLELAEDLPRAIGADRGEFEAVVVNLVVNARDAMPGGGEVMITATAETFGSASSSSGSTAAMAPGRYLRVSVSDSGVGMDVETLARAAEPFFTTKPPGVGTGLGLPMARAFAEAASGAFSIASAPGRGTTVTFWLPAARA